MFYSLVNDVKTVMLTFFQFLFFENKKGNIKFTNGTRRVEFSNEILVIEAYQWEIQKHPAVLIDSAVGNMGQLSISKDFIRDDGQYLYFGGESNLDVTISCVAKTREERDNLVDICALYLSRPDTKRYFLNQALDIPTPVSITGESVIDSTNTDFQLYQTDLVLSVHSQWEEPVDPAVRLNEIIVRLDYDDDPPEGKVVL